jgi:4-hydroxy-3-polyprenylbenzoate decarboxylase
MGTLGRIAAGTGENLVTRAADVCLKERRPLVVVPREAPLSAIHLENMLRLVRAGASVVPAAPGFYQDPRTVDDLIRFVVARVMEQLGLEQELTEPWRG